MEALLVPNSLYTSMMEQVSGWVRRATGGAVTANLNDPLVGGTQVAASVYDGRVPMSDALHTNLAGKDLHMGSSTCPG